MAHPYYNVGDLLRWSGKEQTPLATRSWIHSTTFVLAEPGDLFLVEEAGLLAVACRHLRSGKLVVFYIDGGLRLLRKVSALEQLAWAAE